jgi:DNA-binding transcriptional MerR regulator
MANENDTNDATLVNQPFDASDVTSESAHETRGEESQRAGQNEPPHLLSIDEVARRTELSKPTLRFYEQKGLVEPPARLPRKFRKYSPQDLEQLERIKQLRDLLGLSLNEIEETLRIDKEHARLVELAQAQWAEVSDKTILKSQLDEAKRLNQEQSDEVEKQLEAVDEKIEGLERLRKEMTARKQRVDELEDRIKKMERELKKTR